MINPKTALSRDEAGLLVKRRMPDWLEPMLATLTEDYFSDAEWIYEPKLDGQRCLVFKNGKQVSLLSRNRQDISATYPELVESLRRKVVKTCIMDGEIVAFRNNLSSFSRLQQRMQTTDPPAELRNKVTVYLYLFDLLYLDGYLTTALPLRSRKALLRRAIGYNDPLKFTAHRNEHGKAFYREACKHGWEGIIAKDGNSPYEHARSVKWLKFKCVLRQEMVIGGWTEPQGSRRGFGALLIGYYDDGQLIYAGKVGTGFSDAAIARLSDELLGLERRTSPFAEGLPDGEGNHYVEPVLVAEIGFTEWTAAGRLRHPRFLGLRDDKPAAQVSAEQ